MNPVCPEYNKASLLNDWEKTHIASILDRNRKFTLIFGARAGDGTRGNLAIGRNEFLEGFDILIIDELDVVLFEIALLLARTHFLKSHSCLSFLNVPSLEGEVVVDDINPVKVG